MSRAGQPGGRFDARYEAHSASAGIRDDMEGPFGQLLDWWVYDPDHSAVDPIYDVGAPGIGGRTWTGPYHLPVVSAHLIQGRSPQEDPEGFFNTDRLRAVIRVDTIRQVGIHWADWHPDKLLFDRIVWRDEVFKPESVQPRAITGHQRYLVISVDANQIRPDELINDPAFEQYWNDLTVGSGPVHLYGSSGVRLARLKETTSFGGVSGVAHQSATASLGVTADVISAVSVVTGAAALDATTGVGLGSISIATGYVRLSTTGANFNPTVELANGSSATVTWTCEETAQVLTGTNPTFAFGSVANRHVRMSATNLADITTINLGFNSGDDAGNANMGGGYNKTAQAVSQIEGVNQCTGLVRFAAANGNLAGSLDFTGCSELQFIECFYANVNAVTLTGCTSLLRLCLEHTDLTSPLDLNPVATNLYDLRAAIDREGALTLTPLTQPLSNLYHFCVRDQVLTGHPTPAQLPAVVQRWDWNTNQSGPFVSVSNALYDVQSQYNAWTSADLTNQYPAGRSGKLNLSHNMLTSIVLTGCSGLTEIDLSANSFNQSAVDGILAVVDSWSTSGGWMSLTSTVAPSSTGTTHVTALRGRGWTVLVDAPKPPGVNSDDFERANATGLAAVGNGWYTPGSATANIVNGDLVRTDYGGYELLLNPGDSGSPLPADYTVTASIPAATIGQYWGIVGRWAGGNGVRVMFYADSSSGQLFVGQASGYAVGDVFTNIDAAFPAGWSSGTGDHTIAAKMSGTTISVYLDGVLVRHGTLSTNSAATGTGFGICGQGLGRAWHSIGTTVP